MTKNDSEKFEQIFSDNHHRLFLHALRFVRDESEAEDIVADVFLDLWRRFEDIDTELGIATYLYRAVSTRALNCLRHQNVAAVRIESLEAINEKRMEFIAHDDLENVIYSKEIEHGIKQALSALPDKCRQVFVLQYVNGLKSKEIADALDISVRTVEAHIYKALRLLRNHLKYLVGLTAVVCRLADFINGNFH